jgi:hypothetical protein
MIALEVKLNGKRVCIAGADDMAVLSADVTACGKLGKKTVPRRPNATEIYYSVGGLSPRPNGKDIYPKWKLAAPLQVGDVLEVRILETEKVDRAISRNTPKRKRANHA